MSPSGGEEQVLTYLEAGGPPSQSLQEQEAEGKGGVSGRLVKGNDTPPWCPEDCLSLHSHTYLHSMAPFMDRLASLRTGTPV